MFISFSTGKLLFTTLDDVLEFARVCCDKLWESLLDEAVLDAALVARRWLRQACAHHPEGNAIRSQ
jgi:hypothetical protein